VGAAGLEPATPLLYLDRVGFPRSPRMECVAAKVGDPVLLLPYAVASGFYTDVLQAGFGENLVPRIGEASRAEQLGAFKRPTG
jgi:hypothetical protein